MAHFERYRSIIDDYDSFCESLSRPLPVTLWANPERVASEVLEKRLEEIGFTPRRLKWFPGGFRLPEHQRAGKRWEFFAGLYQIQEEAAMAPAMVLAPKPGECVLDMCAAPGNKTAQMSFLMQQQGTIIANDINSKRLAALRQTGERLGIRNVTSCNFNGANLPGDAGCFDKIMVDAPCSCEGTTRKNLNVRCEAEELFSQKQSQAQTALLFKAAQLCKPGGDILYATCTYAPEENEEVVDAVLKKYGEMNLEVMDISIPGLIAMSGITEWEGREFSPQIKKSARIWPHFNDTGGFFMCRLRKLQNRSSSATTSQGVKARVNEKSPGKADSPHLRQIVDEVKTRYQVPADLLDSLRYYQHGEQIYAVNKQHQVPEFFRNGLDGMRFLHSKSVIPKLTHPAALLCGKFAVRNFVVLDKDQLGNFLKRKMVVLDRNDINACEEGGYVLVKHAGFSVGTGIISSAASGHKVLKSQFPKSWSKRLFSEAAEPS